MKTSNEKGQLTKTTSPNNWIILGLGTALFIISMSLIYPLVSKDILWFMGFFIFIVVSLIMVVIYIAWVALIAKKKSQVDDHINRQLAGDLISNSDNYLYHWEYTKRDKEWIARDIILEGFLGLLWSPLIMIILLIIQGVLRGNLPNYQPTGDPIKDFINVFGGVIILGGILGLITFICSIYDGLKKLINIPDVYIGENAIYENGKYWSWEGTRYHLTQINLSGRVLKFELFYQVQEQEKDQDFALTMRLFADEPTGEISRSIFVPLGQETAANEVVERLSKKCIPQRKVSRTYDGSDDYYGDSYYGNNDSSDSDNSCSWGDSGDSGDSCSSDD
jgi:hypothetical protein